TLELVNLITINESEALMLRWILELNDLELSDALATHVGGAWILGDVRSRLDRVREWVNSPQKHQRQFGVMSLMPLAKLRNFGDVSLALSTLTGAMREEDVEVRKSVARVIREMSVRGPNETAIFLATWSDTIDKNTDWIVRHSVEKLDLDTRNNIVGALRGRTK
ncbi:MAG: DNA alkylation repair protein, partial [Chloroflexota bacterium]